jgi:hypothetical protein
MAGKAPMYSRVCALQYKEIRLVKSGQGGILFVFVGRCTVKKASSCRVGAGDRHIRGWNLSPTPLWSAAPTICDRIFWKFLRVPFQHCSSKRQSVVTNMVDAFKHINTYYTYIQQKQIFPGSLAPC